MDTKLLKCPDENGHKKRGNNAGHNGNNPSKTGESQQQKCENAISLAIIVNNSNAALDADEDNDNDSNRTNYKTNKTRANGDNNEN